VLLRFDFLHAVDQSGDEAFEDAAQDLTLDSSATSASQTGAEVVCVAGLASTHVGTFTRASLLV